MEEPLSLTREFHSRIIYDEFQGHVPRNAFIITDRYVKKHYLSGYERTFEVKDKSFQCYHDALKWLSDSGAHRNSSVFAIGGGTVGDLAGFAASTYMRGIKLIMIPTTLLAMVDSSIGGKTAIDLGDLKNQIGSFYPADKIVVDLRFLETLKQEQKMDGMAEMIKIAAATDLELFTAIETKIDLMSLIKRSIGLKRMIVSKDFLDNGIREKLNFGHTVGHAIELSYGLSHGKAVSLGMVIESKIAKEVNGFSESSRLIKLLESAGLPTQMDLDKEKIISFMRHDKKFHDSHRIVLLSSIGDSEVRSVNENIIRRNL